MAKIKIYAKSYYVPYLNAFSVKVLNYLKKNVFLEPKQSFLQSKIQNYTLLRSPHADKKARDQFRRQVYKRVFTFKIPSITKKKIHQLNYFLQSLNIIAIGIEFRIVYEI